MLSIIYVKSYNKFLMESKLYIFLWKICTPGESNASSLQNWNCVLSKLWVFSMQLPKEKLVMYWTIWVWSHSLDKNHCLKYFLLGNIQEGKRALCIELCSLNLGSQACYHKSHGFQDFICWKTYCKSLLVRLR